MSFRMYKLRYLATVRSAARGIKEDIRGLCKSRDVVTLSIALLLILGGGLSWYRSYLHKHASDIVVAPGATVRFTDKDYELIAKLECMEARLNCIRVISLVKSGLTPYRIAAHSAFARMEDTRLQPLVCYFLVGHDQFYYQGIVSPDVTAHLKARTEYVKFTKPDVKGVKQPVLQLICT